jgi:hypothetical protein
VVLVTKMRTFAANGYGNKKIATKRGQPAYNMMLIKKTMKRTVKVILSILLMILGWFLACWGFTTTIGHPTSTICFLAGLGLFFVGLIYPITLKIQK